MNEQDLLHDNIHDLEKRTARLRNQPAPTVPIYDLGTSLFGSLRSKFEGRDATGDSPRYTIGGFAAVLFPGGISSVYSRFDFYISEVDHQLWMSRSLSDTNYIFTAQSQYTFAGAKANRGNPDIDPLLLMDSTSHGDWGYADFWGSSWWGSYIAGTWDTVDFHFNSGNVNWKMGGVDWPYGNQDTGTPTIGSVTFGYSANLIGHFPLISNPGPGYVNIYYDNISLGTTGYGSSDLFSANFESGTLNSIFGSGNWESDDSSQPGVPHPNAPYLLIDAAPV